MSGADSMMTDDALNEIYEYLDGKSVWASKEGLRWLADLGVLPERHFNIGMWVSAQPELMGARCVKTYYTKGDDTVIKWSEFKRFINRTLNLNGGTQAMKKHTIELTQKQVDVMYAVSCCHKEGQQDLLEAFNEVSRALWSLTSISGLSYTTSRLDESSKIKFNQTEYPPLAWQKVAHEDQE